MKFIVGFLVAVFVFMGLAGVVVADCSCQQLTPTALGGEWGKTPLTTPSFNSSVSVEWQTTINFDRWSSRYNNRPLFYMNPASREAAVRVYGGDPNLPVLHANWYDNNPSYSAWYRNSDGTLPNMTLWDSLSIQNKYGW
jgi:hypothetical protein